MINSWKAFLYAVADMRKMQKEMERSKSVEKQFELLQLQLEVDSCVERKIAEFGGRQRKFDFPIRGEPDRAG